MPFLFHPPDRLQVFLRPERAFLRIKGQMSFCPKRKRILRRTLLRLWRQTRQRNGCLLALHSLLMKKPRFCKISKARYLAWSEVPVPCGNAVLDSGFEKFVTLFS